MSPEGKPDRREFAAQAVHLVRTSTMANLALSQMADQKASILLGATSLVFTIAVSQAGGGHFPLPLLVLAFFSFLAAIFAVAVVMPAVRPPPALPDTENLMFFGVFSQIPESEFTERMLDNLACDEVMFRTMLRDIWQNGQVLQRKKYRFLGYAYLLFLCGLVATFAAFLFESRHLLA